MATPPPSQVPKPAPTAAAPQARPRVYIGVAWPYANGPLHLGHVAGSLLPPDIFRRAMTMLGRDVLMVSGSDCHGTPIMIKAEKEGRTPQQVVEQYHAEHKEALARLGIEFSLFTTTTTANHREWVQRIFLAAKEMGYIEARTSKAPYDAKAGRFLPDRYVEGTCPHCQAPGARGDQCEACGKTLDPKDLKDPVSKLAPGNPVTFRDTEHFFFLLSRLQPALERYVAATAGHWRASTINFTQAWLREGLQDRAITRDLAWGIPIPLSGYDDKRIYVWFEAVCGYLSASVEWASRLGRPDEWQRYWTDPACKGYYFLGKDNIPFHTIIWPAILLAFNEARAKKGERPLNLPFDVPANEFLNLSGLKFSKSQGVGIGVHEVLDRFEADAVRYYLAINMPEGKDTDWAWEDFQSKVNDELVGTLGNLVHRVLSLTQRDAGAIPAAPGAGHALDAKVSQAVAACGSEMALHLGAVRLRPAMRRLMDLAIQGNQWMQEAQPWARLKTDRAAAHADLHALLRLCKGLAVYMAPFMPTAAQSTWAMLGEEGSVHEAGWDAAARPLKAGHTLAEPKALFVKLEPDSVRALAGPASSAPSPAAASPAATGPGQPGPADAASRPPARAAAGALTPQAKASPPSPSAVAAPQPPGAAAGDVVTIEEFSRIQLRLARVSSVEAHPKADKLYVIRLDAGDLGERQVVAGLKAHYLPADLVGRTVAFVANLKPALLRGVESQGMILAADDGTRVAILSPEKDLQPGSRIR